MKFTATNFNPNNGPKVLLTLTYHKNDFNTASVFITPLIIISIMLVASLSSLFFGDFWILAIGLAFILLTAMFFYYNIFKVESFYSLTDKGFIPGKNQSLLSYQEIDSYQLNDSIVMIKLKNNGVFRFPFLNHKKEIGRILDFYVKKS